MDTIINYFDSTCRIIIDEFNFIFKNMIDDEKMEYANEKFCEADFAFRLGSPFRNLARYTIQGTRGKDIIIDHKDFQIEVKYWRNYAAGNSRVKARWAESFENDILWLNDEISESKGNKGRRALIAGWSTIFPWNKLLQFGSGDGSKPLVNRERLAMFPFLSCKDDFAKSIYTTYTQNKSSFSLYKRPEVINWYLIGEATDSFNIVIFW